MSTLSPDDGRAIRAVVQGLVDAWHARDAESFASAFESNAAFFNVFGQKLCGRTEIAAHHAQLFAGVYSGSRISDVGVAITCVTPSVAVVTWSSVLNLADEARRAHAHTVFVREAERWVIVSLQNMLPLSLPA